MSIPAKKDLPPSEITHPRHHPLLGLRQEVDSLFDNFFTHFSLDPFRRMDLGLMRSPDLMPSMDVKETDKELRVSAELPGMNEEDIELSLNDGKLIIKGEKKEENLTENENRHLTERRFGSIYRSLALPDDVDEDSVEATYDKGILMVTLKKVKSKGKKNKTVKIRAFPNYFDA